MPSLAPAPPVPLIEPPEELTVTRPVALSASIPRPWSMLMVSVLITVDWLASRVVARMPPVLPVIVPPVTLTTTLAPVLVAETPRPFVPVTLAPA